MTDDSYKTTLKQLIESNRKQPHVSATLKTSSSQRTDSAADIKSIPSEIIAEDQLNMLAAVNKNAFTELAKVHGVPDTCETLKFQPKMRSNSSSSSCNYDYEDDFEDLEPAYIHWIKADDKLEDIAKKYRVRVCTFDFPLCILCVLIPLLTNFLNIKWIW